MLFAISGRPVASVSPGTDPTEHIVAGTSAWRAVQDNNPLDCESVSFIAAAELHQIGIASAVARKAYPTGAILDGDTNAESAETKLVSNQTYSLTYEGQLF